MPNCINRFRMQLHVFNDVLDVRDVSMNCELAAMTAARRLKTPAEHRISSSTENPQPSSLSQSTLLHSVATRPHQSTAFQSQPVDHTLLPFTTPTRTDLKISLAK